jgi:hypothetical protein
VPDPRELHSFAPLDPVEPVLLATGARDAARAMPCAGCERAILRAQRIADLPDGGGTVHASCAAVSR